jgi:hypothetical protein
MNCDYLVPYPENLTAGQRTFAKPATVSVQADAAGILTARGLTRDLKTLARVSVQPRARFAIKLRVAERPSAKPESYRLRLTSRGANLVGADAAGLFYGVQTLLQIFVLAPTDAWTSLRIDDAPHYTMRSLMVDMGRAPYRLPLLKRIVRILSRLKMNVLHLHLNDDQLCGLRFKRLPLGSENPESLSIADLKALVRYAARYHVRILPEFECWGHAASIIYHYPDLYGGPGMWGGMSLGIGEETFAFFEKVFDELLPALEQDCHIHLGLDEAVWALLESVPSSRRKHYSPTDLVRRLDIIVDEAAKKHGRRPTLHLWADHGGRPLPKRMRCRAVVQPWMYFEAGEADIKAKLKQYGGKHKPPFMMGGGMSGAHFGGHYGATRLWCRHGAKIPNVAGITICLWETNDLAGRMIGLYAGADCAWSPATPPAPHPEFDPHGESQRAVISKQMRVWQTAFRDADADAINLDRGPEVHRGLYAWGPNAGQPVAPTGTWSHTIDHGGQDDKRTKHI